MIYITADQHFRHSAAPSFPDRNFKSSAEMDACLIKKWNSRITDDDTVYILGDYVFGTDVKDLANINSLLKGKKILVLGNHDRFTVREYMRYGIHHVYDLPILLNGNLLLSHEPVLTLGEHGLVNVHGHTHGRNFAQRTSKHFCACVDCHKMYPVPITTIYSKISFT